jgi:DDE superfamily endonuclease
VAAGAIVEDGSWLDRLQGELRGLLAPVFAQARSRLAAFAYIGALLTEPGDRRSCRQLAERAGHATPRRMQAVPAGHARDWAAALAVLQRFILARLGDRGAILVLDETAELKKGARTVGVARQHAGITGQGRTAGPWCPPPASPPVPIPCSTSGSTCRNSGVRTSGGANGRTSRTTWSSPPSQRWVPR